MKKSLLLLILVCISFPLLNLSCKKDEGKDLSRVYFTYRVGYYERTQKSDGSFNEQCIAGDGLCDFVTQESGWKPAGTMPEGYGFGYMTLTTKLKIKMVIYMPFMPTATYKQHYEDGIASLPGPWRVAVEMTRKLGLTDGYTVAMGDYSVGLGHEDGYDVLIITF
jgi:hypothetical protein